MYTLLLHTFGTAHARTISLFRLGFMLHQIFPNHQRIRLIYLLLLHTKTF